MHKNITKQKKGTENERKREYAHRLWQKQSLFRNFDCRLHKHIWITTQMKKKLFIKNLRKWNMYPILCQRLSQVYYVQLDSCMLVYSVINVCLCRSVAPSVFY